MRRTFGEVPVDVRVDAVSPHEVAHSGVPDNLVDPIRQWIGRSERIVFGVILVDRTAQAWTTLGEYIVRALAARSLTTGVHLSGMVPLAKVVNVLQASNVEERPTICTLTCTTDRRLFSEVTWNLFQVDHTAVWAKTLWLELGSEWFNQGAELIVSGYTEDFVSNLKGGTELSDHDFLLILQQAYCWVVPLDENLGFIMGGPPDLPEQLLRFV